MTEEKRFLIKALTKAFEKAIEEYVNISTGGSFWEIAPITRIDFINLNAFYVGKFDEAKTEEMAERLIIRFLEEYIENINKVLSFESNNQSLPDNREGK